MTTKQGMKTSSQHVFLNLPVNVGNVESGHGLKNRTTAAGRGFARRHSIEEYLVGGRVRQLQRRRSAGHRRFSVARIDVSMRWMGRIQPAASPAWAGLEAGVRGSGIFARAARAGRRSTAGAGRLQDWSRYRRAKMRTEDPCACSTVAHHHLAYFTGSTLPFCHPLGHIIISRSQIHALSYLSY